MIVDLQAVKGYCKVTREKGDLAFRNSGWSDGESRLLYHMKKILNARGYDLIKKRMYKDGHLVSDAQQYLRTRKPSGDPLHDLYIYNSNWCVQGADVDFRHAEAVFSVETDVFNAPKKKD